MKKIFGIFLLFLIMILSGCMEQEVDDCYYSFFDSRNELIVLKSKPNNVAILFSSFVEIYNCAGGNTNITVGESVERGIVSKNVILVDAGAGKTINNEILIKANPDFVIGSLDISEQVKTCNLLSGFGIACALFKVETFEDYLYVLDILTDITGNKDLYQKNGINVKNNIDSIKSRYLLDSDAKVLFIRSGASQSSCKAKNSESHFACKMLNELGTVNIADSAFILLDGLSIEEILLNEPDYIFISIMGNEESGKKYINELLNSMPYNSLKAVKNSSYYFLPKDLFQYKPNQRWDLAYEYLVDILYG